METLPNEISQYIFLHLKCKDLLRSRLVSKHWSSLTSETLRKNSVLVTLSSTITARRFLQLLQNAADNTLFTRIRVAVNNVSFDVLTQLANKWNQYNIQLILFQQTKKTCISMKACMLKEDASEVSLFLLQQLYTITYLKVMSGALLQGSDSATNDDPIKFPTFTNLSKIVWSDVDKKLLLAILKQAPSLRLLEVSNWVDSNKKPCICDAPKIMETLPPQARVGISIPSDCMYIPSEIVHISEMCQFRNKISNLTLLPLTYYRDNYNATTEWKEAMMEFFESQSRSLRSLEIDCVQCFEIPELGSLQLLKMRNSSTLNTTFLPSLRKLAVRGDLSRENVYENVWTTVRSLEFLWESEDKYDDNYYFNKIEISFLNLKSITIPIQQFIPFVQFYRSNNVPAKELCVYDPKVDPISVKQYCDFLGHNFPSSSKQRKSAQLGLLGLNKMKMEVAHECVLHVLALVSCRGEIKLKFLELSLMDTFHSKHCKPLHAYHDNVVINDLELEREVYDSSV